ncbi:MAG: heparinase II/III family protein [Opitutales bacterium]|nr:heparinase II/III family protein [Opitutales bacterium]
MTPLLCASEALETGDWVQQIREDHPRLYFNADRFPAIRAKALGEERARFDAMKGSLDPLFDQELVFTNPLIRDGTHSTEHLLGTQAAKAAFVYLVIEDRAYLELSKRLLARVIEYYHMRHEAQLNVAWTAASRMNALAAYDMICNDLTEAERSEIGGSLFRAMDNMMPDRREAFFREGVGTPEMGFYGTRCLTWYTGLVFHKHGIDDERATELLMMGYRDYISLLEHRGRVAGDVGGSASAALNYAMGHYAWAEFDFFHTFSSATGINMAANWPYVPYLLHYILWNWLPDGKQYGYGDVDHVTNDLPLQDMHMHIAQMIHFYGDTHPELIALAKWMRTQVDKKEEEIIPFAPFIVTENYDEIEPAGPPQTMRTARHFDNMGQVFMRSGSGPDDTYALFTAGGLLDMHRHYDNNNFVIFRNGFLALDSGSRPSPGLHLPFYYVRTVAHNCITIYMPGEEMPRYWGFPAENEKPEPPHPNDGGQNKILGSTILAFDQNEHYAYVASDATDSYHEDKAELVLRQFVFLPPDHFVVFDRVTSTEADYPKRWLLHTAAEPAVDGPQFQADHWEGRIFSRTLLPDDADLTKIGGEGKQFWSDGRNWPMPVLEPGEWGYETRDRIPPDDHDLLGQWRIEVTPGDAREADLFLHLIQVGDHSLESMSASTLKQQDGRVGLGFSHAGRDYEILFNSVGQAGGRIAIRENGQSLLEEELSQQVKQQVGLF